MQTIADLAHRMGSVEAAHVVLGNLNNLIALRTKDQMTQNLLLKRLAIPISPTKVSPLITEPPITCLPTIIPSFPAK